MYASVNIETEEFTKQEQIDELFTELNELALEKKVQQNSTSTYSSTATTNQISSMESQIEQELANLGVKKIDSSSTEDISRLSNLVNSTNSTTRSNFDFSMLADVYSIYEYSGTRTINGTSYDYE